MAKYSVERLVHFQCEAFPCQKWWTIGDYVIEMHNTVTCPWCGSEQRLIHITKGV